MLLELSAQNVALNSRSSLEFEPGFTCITGETGAGKSLTVDALNLALGGRAEVSLIKDGAAKAEVSALFAISQSVKDRLKELDLTAENEDQLILRRVISRDGRNKAYINGHLSTITLLKEFAARLVSIHGQHASYKLLDSSYQLSLIDGRGGLEAELKEVQSRFARYQSLRANLTALSTAQKEGALRYKSLRYEQELLSKLNFKQGDYEELSARFDQSMHAQKLLDAVSLASAALSSDEHNLIEIIAARSADLTRVLPYEPRLAPVIKNLTQAMECLDDARLQLGEVESTLNPDDSAVLSERLALCHDLARRFNVEPQQLYAVQERVEGELKEFLSLREKIETAAAAVKEARQRYEEAAAVLSQKRVKAAKLLSQEVSALIKTLAMPEGRFEIKLWCEEGVRPRAQGRDETAFLFTANAGQDLKDLGSAASGGELSRLALAIEAVTASARSTPTIIFDEVDTGISGRTASAVGALLRRLAQSVQVLTVTHLPQVAAAADAQFLVKKDSQDGQTVSKVLKLDRAGRIEELARMMGGTVVTEATRQSAAALLKESSGS